MTLFSSLCNSLSALVRDAQSLVVLDHIAGIINAKSDKVDLEFYENVRYYEKLHHAQGQDHRSISIIKNLTQLVKNGISLIAMVGLLLSFHWIFTLVLFITVLPRRPGAVKIFG